MSALSFGVVRRWSLEMLASAVVCGVVVAGVSACSGGGQTPQAADAAIVVQTSQMFVTIENRAGLPLTDVDVAILPVGNPTPYNKFVGRLENGQKRDLSLGDFAGRDGTTFSLRLVRPKTVRVKAKDMVGKVYDVAVPWQ
jgi:hypothetical protein